MTKVRSPLFYVGDKYKLIPQLKKLMPNNIETFYDAFAGGGSASMGIDANKYKMNDIDINVIHLHEYLRTQVKHLDKFLSHMYALIHHYGLTCSAKNELPDNFQDIKSIYKKTYYARINKEGYLKLRDDYNSDQTNMDLLYLLLVFGFNHMTRFNREGKFNLPVGNVDWNNNVERALSNYARFSNTNKIALYNMDFSKFLLKNNIKENDFVYLDPPYLITFSEYNKLWDNNTEERLYNVLDCLNNRNISWGLSNVLTHKGKTNTMLLNWIKSHKYYVYPIESNYISRFDNTIKKDTKEVFVMNKPKGERN